ncbi:MAG: hypothetical protein AB1422_06710 [bacterium]
MAEQLQAGRLLEVISDWSGFLGNGLKEEEMEVMRSHRCTGRVLGSEEFIRQVEVDIGLVLCPLKR